MVNNDGSTFDISSVYTGMSQCVTQGCTLVSNNPLKREGGGGGSSAPGSDSRLYEGLFLDSARSSSLTSALMAQSPTIVHSNCVLCILSACV